MQENENGNQIIHDYSLKDWPSKKHIEDSDRHEVVRTAAAYLFRVCGPYPISQEKTKVAFAIIELFPSLRITRDGVLPYVLVYNAKNTNNPLDRRLKILREGLPVDVRKRKSSGKPPSKQGRIDPSLVQKTMDDEIESMEFKVFSLLYISQLNNFNIFYPKVNWMSRHKAADNVVQMSTWNKRTNTGSTLHSTRSLLRLKSFECFLDSKILTMDPW